ncbi:MAG TPA: hypothetical protein PKC18_09120, partial [Lacipirellulaceae bacterium]|nr:hypothetical protein [Lacipirellulaceae bacterium]
TALATRRNELRPELRQAFVQAANFSDEPCVATVSLRLDGALVDARDLRIPAGEVAGATFSLGERAAGALEARLEPPAAFDDRLSADNVAYAVLDSGQAARILVVTPGNNRAMLAALATGRVARLAAVEQIRPEQLADDAVQRQLQAGAYSLAVFDQCAPASAEQMPRCNTLFVGRAPPTAAWQESVGAAPAAGPQIIDWHRAHPLLHLVELGNVAVVDSLIVTPPAGGQVLVDSTRGPLAAIAPRESYEDAVLGFEIVGRTADGAATVNTNWPRRHSFPNFWLNVVQYLAGGAAESQAAQLAPGATAEIVAPRPGARLTVTLPDGSTRRLDAPAAGPAAFRETDQLGVYQVRDGDQPVARLAVNLFDRQESDVRLRAEPVAGGGAAVAPLALGYADVPAQAPNEAARRELWTPLLLAVLGVLTLEWYIYNRRVYV